jgi:hypothetical protein
MRAQISGEKTQATGLRKNKVDKIAKTHKVLLTGNEIPDRPMRRDSRFPT